MGWVVKLKTLCEGKGNLLVNYQHDPRQHRLVDVRNIVRN